MTIRCQTMRMTRNKMTTIKEARKAAGLTQAAAAEMIGVPKRTWEDWEGEKHSPPEYVKRLIIEKLLNL